MITAQHEKVDYKTESGTPTADANYHELCKIDHIEWVIYIL